MTTSSGTSVAAPPTAQDSPLVPARRLGGRTVLTLALIAVVSLVAYRETRPVVFGRALDLYKVPTDFMVYFRAGEALAHHGNIYDGALYGPLPFTYPPFAGTLFRGLAVAPAEMSATFWQLACIGALVCVILGTLVRRGYRLDAGTVALGSAAALAALALSPVRDSFFYGQINMLLMLLVSLDFLRTRDRFTGIGVGIAAGLKLTPAFFILVFLMQRRWRDAATATVTFVVTVVVGLLTVPDAMRFWTSAIFDSTRIGSDTISASQSLKGFTERTFGETTLGTAVWLLACAVVVILLYAAVRWATRHDNQPLVMALGGITACLVSPFSWHHHWVWLVPLVVCLVDLGVRSAPSSTGGRIRSWAVAQATTAVGVLVVYVAMIPFVSHQISVHWSFIGQQHMSAPMDNMWVLWGFLIVTAFAVTALVEWRRTPLPCRR
ncbi:glycosyltransferase 87 family protein [Corynebacterium glyciniphilum]|uniref:glycosyltransferase 87 family protein n=1 Tax=Corynebacterium glyciniphilum TaxID=1404244 RepID=UPI000A49D102|nr:glycosyltransferase 87 family protein [Corynebacterium glyciniphilum]